MCLYILAINCQLVVFIIIIILSSCTYRFYQLCVIVFLVQCKQAHSIIMYRVKCLNSVRLSLLYTWLANLVSARVSLGCDNKNQVNIWYTVLIYTLHLSVIRNITSQFDPTKLVNLIAHEVVERERITTRSVIAEENLHLAYHGHSLCQSNGFLIHCKLSSVLPVTVWRCRCFLLPLRVVLVLTKQPVASSERRPEPVRFHTLSLE